jgi:hypothetical protein
MGVSDQGDIFVVQVCKCRPHLRRHACHALIGHVRIKLFCHCPLFFALLTLISLAGRHLSRKQFVTVRARYHHAALTTKHEARRSERMQSQKSQMQSTVRRAQIKKVFFVTL